MEVFHTNCAHCNRDIYCWWDNGVITNPDFNLWGDIALCYVCSSELDKQYKAEFKSQQSDTDT